MRTIAQGSKTRIHAVRLAVFSRWPIKKVCGHCRVSRATLWRWVGRYDGTEFSDRAFRKEGAPGARRGAPCSSGVSLHLSANS